MKDAMAREPVVPLCNVARPGLRGQRVAARPALGIHILQFETHRPLPIRHVRTATIDGAPHDMADVGRRTVAEAATDRHHGVLRSGPTRGRRANAIRAVHIRCKKCKDIRASARCRRTGSVPRLIHGSARCAQVVFPSTTACDRLQPCARHLLTGHRTEGIFVVHAMLVEQRSSPPALTPWRTAMRRLLRELARHRPRRDTRGGRITGLIGQERQERRSR